MRFIRFCNVEKARRKLDYCLSLPATARPTLPRSSQHQPIQRLSLGPTVGICTAYLLLSSLVVLSLSEVISQPPNLSIDYGINDGMSLPNE